MITTASRLAALCKAQPKFLQKGGLCVALVVTRTAKEKGLPLNPESLRTVEQGQVTGLGKAAVQKILEEHGITRVLAEEGGRTSRGSLGLMRSYVETLNKLTVAERDSLDDVEVWWIEQVRAHFAKEGPKFYFDPGKSLRTNIDNLLEQAHEVQSNSGGTNYVGAMLQHLVGAKLDIVLGEGKVTHHGSSVADHSTERTGDFHIETVAIHVTTHPNEALIRKCEGNLRKGLQPVIITVHDGVTGAVFLLRNADLIERVDVLDASQFLTANVLERSFFKMADCKITLTRMLNRYNQIVSTCEADPTLKVAFGKEL